MTKLEFAPIMAYVSTAIGKSLDPAALDIYYDLLGDLPVDALQTAVRKVVLTHKWLSFPTVAELREAAAETMRGIVTDLSPAEAWKLAWDAVGRIDPEQDGSTERHLAKVPRLVVEAIRTFGLCAMAYGKEPVGVVRGQFMDVYKQLLAREQRLALLPERVKADVQRIGGEVPKRVASAIGKIGAFEDH